MALCNTTFVSIGAGVYTAMCVSNVSSTGCPLRGKKPEARHTCFYQLTAVDLFICSLSPIEMNPDGPMSLLKKNEGCCIFEVTHISIYSLFLTVPLVLAWFVDSHLSLYWHWWSSQHSSKMCAQVDPVNLNQWLDQWREYKVRRSGCYGQTACW